MKKIYIDKVYNSYEDFKNRPRHEWGCNGFSSQELLDKSNLVDCRGCWNCIDCVNCENSYDLIKCIGVHNSYKAKECKHSLHLKECYRVSASFRCVGCSDLYNCTQCINSKNCQECFRLEDCCNLNNIAHYPNEKTFLKKVLWGFGFKYQK